MSDIDYAFRNQWEVAVLQLRTGTALGGEAHSLPLARGTKHAGQETDNLVRVERGTQPAQLGQEAHNLLWEASRGYKAWFGRQVPDIDFAFRALDSDSRGLLWGQRLTTCLVS